METQTEKKKLYYIAVPFSEVVHGVEYYNVEAKDIDNAIELIKNGNAYVDDRGEIEYGAFNMYIDDMQVCDIAELDDVENKPKGTLADIFAEKQKLANRHLDQLNSDLEKIREQNQ